jgi:hypothetical protein
VPANDRVDEDARESRNEAIVGSLFAHNGDRHPAATGGSTLAAINNLMYDAEGARPRIGITVFIPSSQEDVGGWPELPENHRELELLGISGKGRYTCARRAPRRSRGDSTWYTSDGDSAMHLRRCTPIRLLADLLAILGCLSIESIASSQTNGAKRQTSAAFAPEAELDAGS